MKKDEIIDTPRTLQYNGAVFSEADVQFLKKQFSDLDMTLQHPVDIRNSPVWKSAIESGVVVIRIVNPKANSITIHLTQQGRKLLEKV